MTTAGNFSGVMKLIALAMILATVLGEPRAYALTGFSNPSQAEHPKTLLSKAAPADPSGYYDAPATAVPEADSDYRIGAEDVLHIDVWKETDLSATVPVRADGKISMPLLNDVQASGMTPIELSASLRKQFQLSFESVVHEKKIEAAARRPWRQRR